MERRIREVPIVSSVLDYEVVTDPTPLLARPGTPAVGAVRVVVSNPHPRAGTVKWFTIEVKVPVGTGASDLTSGPTEVRPTITPDSFDAGEKPTFAWEPTERVFRATYPGGVGMAPGQSMVLSLEDVPVAAGEGLVLLQVREFAAGGESRLPKSTRYVTLPVQKRAARVPTNLRPEKALVDTGGDVVLLWDGPDDLDYTVLLPDGTPGGVVDGVAPGSHRWRPNADTAPRRGTTYTLIARRGQQEGHFLTTTVHVRNPEFETLTADTAIHTPRIQGTTTGGRLSLTATGVDVENSDGRRGNLTAADADVNGLVAYRAQVNHELWAARSEATELTAALAHVRDLTATTADLRDVTTTTTGQVSVTGQLLATEVVTNEFSTGQARVIGQLTAERVHVKGEFTTDAG
ncbi:hypothetical protein ACFRCG_39385 [Embleya sp. NPDC056575]|uniref:hypothetical protein n=1 Tax=unclassified Embleya TaxID=2699296 RepID=UPI0036C3FB29